MFLKFEDLLTGSYSEMLTALSRNDLSFIEIKMANAIQKINSFISSKYNTPILWAQQNEERNSLILSIAVDITIYDIHSVVNDDVPIIIRERYEYALQLLKDIRNGKNIIPDLPLLGSDLNNGISQETIGGGISTRY